MVEVAAAEIYIDESLTFDSFDLDPRLSQAIKQLGFKNPTLVQSKAIPLALQEKRDIIAKATTGSGKTVAYSVPIIQSILTSKASNENSKHQIQSIILVPTRELATQVTNLLKKLIVYCGKAIKLLNLSSQMSEQVLDSLLTEKPEILISTPSKLILALERNSNVDIKELTTLVIDEVDLILSYGYSQDLEKLSTMIVLKKNLQTFLMSATLSEDLDDIKSKFCRRPAILKLNDDELKNTSKLVQYYINTTEFDKFLLAYVIFKLDLIKGKTLVFVNSIERGYRLKLFLEQFGIKSCILNSELPINSRLHIVEEYNKNVYNLLIATDDSENIKEVDEDVEETEQDAEEIGSQKADKKDKVQKDKEYGVSRGVDFRNVACVLNFDLPTTARNYVHRVGRTARAGKSGMALSFVIPEKEVGKHKASSLNSAKKDEKILRRIIKQQTKLGYELNPYKFDMKQAEGFRYRAEDAFRAVTQVSIREARVKELKSELLTSEKLKRHFEENPHDMGALRHDKELHPARVQNQLKRVPEYLLPESVRNASKKSLGFIPYNKHRVTKKKKSNKKAGIKSDPLKTFRSKK